MKTKYFSLCIILLIVLLCTTVSATNNEDHNITNITDEINSINADTSNLTNQLSSQITSNLTTTPEKSVTVEAYKNKPSMSKANKVVKQDNQNTKTTKNSKNYKKNTNKKKQYTNYKPTKNVKTAKQIQEEKQQAESQKAANKTKEIFDLKTANQTTNTYSITGKVTEVYNETSNTYAGGEEDGHAVQNAKISVYNSNGKLLATTTSNKNGEYKVDSLVAGNYSVSFEYKTYAVNTESITITNKSRRMDDYVFIPDIAIISYSGSTAEDGQKEKVQALRNISDRVYFLESYDIIEGYDNSNQWMLDFTNFILVDMYSEGNGFGIDTQLIGESPASKNNMIAYTFGIYSEQLFQGNLRSWGFVGGDPYSLENTYVGSYWQAERVTDNQTVYTNMNNFFKYIEYLLGETSYDPTKNNGSPILESSDWGIYYPGHKSFTKTPSQQEINQWILADPGYNDDKVGSLNWMTNELAQWNSENNDPATVFHDFETWYNKNINTTGPFVAIASYYAGGTIIDAMIKEYEKQGRAAFNVYQKSTTPSMTELLHNLTTGSMALKRGVSAVSSLYSWSMDYKNMGAKSIIDNYTDMNVSILKALDAISEASYNSSYGPQAEWTFAVTVPQFEGVFGAIPISYLDENGTEIIIQSGLEKHVQIANGWATLKDMKNKDKKVAVIMYSYPPGKSEIGASYLDVFQTTRDLLIKMYEQGYDVGYESIDEIPSTDELFTIIAELSNKGTWASGLLQQYVTKFYDNLTANGQLISAKQYEEWFNTLPENLQQQQISSWSTGLGNGSMIYNNSIVVPGTFFGNVFISVQPARGWEEVNDYHSDTLAPPQAYVAYYKYLNEILDVDAIVHLGTHGTLEWLPGHTLGMQEKDWSFQLTEKPIIYPYIVSNPGEGMTAKERSFAQVITHMTPITVDSELYGDYVKLEDAMTRYTENLKINATDSDYYIETIRNLSSDLGYREQEEDETFDQYVEYLHSQIESMDTDIITIGLHTIGHIWNDTEMITGAKTIVASRTTALQSIMEMIYPELTNQDYYTLIKDRTFDDKKEEINNVLLNMITLLVTGSSVDEVAEIYGQTNETGLYQDINDAYIIIQGILANDEWNAILTALDGGYVQPGLSADPSYSDVLPTGKSLYASDTTKMPSKNAWQIAKSAVDTMIRSYYENNAGSWPELNAIVIWGTEVLRTEGVSLGEFLYFLGVEPLWDHNGKYTGIKLIPLENLTLTLSDGTIINRPRLDVFTTIVSSNPQWLKMLNDAVELAYEQNETYDGKNIENYLKKHVVEYVEEHNTTVGMLDRVFGLRGAILEGTGVADLAANVVNWQSSSEGISNDLSSVYIARISNAWHVDEHGKINVTNNTDQFKYLLGKLTLLTQNLDSTWRLTDTDDYADWFGGLLNAANTQGARVNTQLLDIRDKNNIVSSTLVEEMQKEVRNTLLNPTYIQSVSDSAAGWNSMAYKVENIMKVMFTTQRYAEDSRGNALRVNYTGNNAGAIGSGLVKQIGKLLVDDNFAINKDYKAYAFQSMAGWLLTTDMNGFWESNQELREQLANKYISIVPQYGIACCHHTCKNFKFNEWVVKTSTVPDSVKNQYLDVMTQATNTDYSKFKSNDPTNTIVEDSADGVEDLDDIITTIGQDASGVDNAVATDPVGQQGTMTRTGDASASLYAEVQGDSSENSNSTSGNDNGQSGGSSGSSASGSSSSGSTSGNSGTGTSASDASGSGTSTNGNSNGTGSSVGDTSSSDGESASAGASGENSASDGISSAAGAVYEVVKKKLSKSAAQESEIAVGYIVAIIAIAVLFFVGFTRKSPRYK